MEFVEKGIKTYGRGQKKKEKEKREKKERKKKEKRNQYLLGNEKESRK